MVSTHLAWAASRGRKRTNLACEVDCRFKSDSGTEELGEPAKVSTAILAAVSAPQKVGVHMPSLSQGGVREKMKGKCIVVHQMIRGS